MSIMLPKTTWFVVRWSFLVLAPLVAAADGGGELGDSFKVIGRARSVIVSTGTDPEGYLNLEQRDFRPDGQILRIVIDGELWAKYSYASTGRLINVTTTWNRETYEYAPDGKLASIAYVARRSGRLTRRVVFKYRDDGTLEYRDSFDAKGELELRITETYDCEHRLKERNYVYYNDATRPPSHSLWFYSSDGVTTRVSYEGDRLESAELYSPGGEVLLSVFCSWNGPRTNIYKRCYIYDRDSRGNWTKQHVRSQFVSRNHPPELGELIQPCGKTSSGSPAWRTIKYYK